MPHKKRRGKGKRKTWLKIGVDAFSIPDILNVRCCCTPKKILGIIPLSFTKDLKLKYFGDEVAVYGDGKPLSFWQKQKGFVGA